MLTRMRVCVYIPIHSPFIPILTFLLQASGWHKYVENIWIYEKANGEEKLKSATQTKHIGHKFFKEDVQNNVESSIYTHCDKSSVFEGKKRSTMST